MTKKLSLTAICFLLLVSAALALVTRVVITSPINGLKLPYGGSIVLNANVEPADPASRPTWSIVEGASSANGRIVTNRTTGVATYYAPVIRSAVGQPVRNLTIRARVGDIVQDTVAITVGTVAPSISRVAPVASVLVSDLVVNQVTVDPSHITAPDGTKIYQLSVEVRNDGPGTFNGRYSITTRSVRADTGATYTSHSDSGAVTIAKETTNGLHMNGPSESFVLDPSDRRTRLTINGWKPGTWYITCTITNDILGEVNTNNTSRAYTIILPDF